MDKNKIIISVIVLLILGALSYFISVSFSTEEAPAEAENISTTRSCTQCEYFPDEAQKSKCLSTCQ